MLIMLATGVFTREMLELMHSHHFFHSYLIHSTTTTSTVWSALLVDENVLIRQLLYVSQPFFLMCLAAVGLEIGSHLDRKHLSAVKGPLAVFLLLFLSILYTGMVYVFRYGGGALLGEEQCIAKLATQLADGSEDAIVGQHATALKTEYAQYLSRMLWCVACVHACLTLERSSAEFLAAMHSTGATGLLPIFALCVAACQDVLALLLFVIVSALVRPTESTSTQRLQRLHAEWVRAKKSVNVTAPELPIGELAAEGGGGAAAELGRTFLATFGSALVVLIVLRVALAVGSCATSPPPNHTRSRADTPTQRERVSSVVLLACLTGILAACSFFLPCELILAAMFTGCVANWSKPCGPLSLALSTVQEYKNVILFTSVGLRTCFSCSAAASGAGGSLVFSLLWGVTFFLWRVLFLWAGGFAGATAARLQKMWRPAQDTPSTRGPSSPVPASASPEAITSSAAGATVVSFHAEEPKEPKAPAVRMYIGLGFITQLAVALSLNARAGDQYHYNVFHWNGAPDHTGESTSWFGKHALPVAPLVQAYMFSIACGMIVGPVLSTVVLRRLGGEVTRKKEA